MINLKVHKFIKNENLCDNISKDIQSAVKDASSNFAILL